MKICFASSSGGHFEQLMMLEPLFKNYDSFIVTEKTGYSSFAENISTYFLKQLNRYNLFLSLYNILYSLYIFIKEKPDLIISTGVLATIPICIWGKISGKRVIYIESYAKVNSGTLTGRFLYYLADVFYVQWPEMLRIYPEAKYIGGIY
ncbi:PssD/Cps14F family polysaccharide biosynthesis glycosyltransferase [Streptococcus suis]